MIELIAKCIQINKGATMTLHIPRLLVWFCCVLTAATIGAMEQNRAAKIAEFEKRTEALAKIKPLVAGPIKVIPHYLYENCNQVTRHTWSADHLARLKKAVPGITKENLEKKCSNNASKYTSAGEAYDWVNALQCIEQTYLGKDRTAISCDDIRSINALVTRLTGQNPGAIRTENIRWNMRQLSVEEFVFLEIMDKVIMQERQFNGEHHIIVDPKNGNLTIDSIKKFFEHYKNNAEQLKSVAHRCIDPEAAKMFGEITDKSFNPDIVDNWKKEQEGVAPEGSFSYRAWLNPRIHMFPSHQELPTLLNRVCTGLKGPRSAFAKACILWFELVRIHAFYEANKRTGRLLSSIIFLENGFLPPLITKEDNEEFLKQFKDNLTKEDGALNFAEYLAKLVERTQSDSEILAQLPDEVKRQIRTKQDTPTKP